MNKLTEFFRSLLVGIGATVFLGLVTLMNIELAHAKDGGGGSGGGGGGLRPLSSVPIPLPTNLAQFVANKDAAIQLGKAFFWDQQTGGDGSQACASCHFQAGGDVRTFNTVNPHGAQPSVGYIPVNESVVPSDFPVNSAEVIGSQGVVSQVFNGVVHGAVDNCTAQIDPIYGNARQVTGRNAPSAVNAIFNFRNFWDGRANNVFNGATPFGPNDTNHPSILKMGSNNVPVPFAVSISNAALASQAVGPANNPVEMSCNGRNFLQLGRKLLGLTPLGQQHVDSTDSVLGTLANVNGPGLKTTYTALIKKAFKPAFVSNASAGNGFSVTENNFSLFWGLAVMLYESTLVSDNTPFDRFAAGDRTALNAQEQLGLNIFSGKGGCTQCHSGPEFTSATVSQANGNALAGFFNIGVRPNTEDGGDIQQPGKGFFKTPTLRNVELNGPYFHNGSHSTLRQVVDFYDRGGDFPVDGITGIHPIGLKETEKNALVSFLLKLTDDRVRFEEAPFDHPSLNVPSLGEIPAVGASGKTQSAQPFLNVDPYQP